MAVRASRSPRNLIRETSRFEQPDPPNLQRLSPRQEIEARLREQMERWLASMDLVTREEFDAVHTMAAKARAEQERLEQRVAALEASLAESAPAKGRAVRSRASKPANPASFAEGSGAED